MYYEKNVFFWNFFRFSFKTLHFRHFWSVVPVHTIVCCPVYLFYLFFSFWMTSVLCRSRVILPLFFSCHLHLSALNNPTLLYIAFKQIILLLSCQGLVSSFFCFFRISFAYLVFFINESATDKPVRNCAHSAVAFSWCW